MLLTINKDTDTELITEHVKDCAVVVVKDFDNKPIMLCEGGLVVLDNPHECKELFKGHWEVVL